MVIFLVVVLLSLAPSLIASSRHKDVVDFDDADIERLYQQWEENDEESEPDDEDFKSEHDRGTAGNYDSVLKDGNFDPQDLMKQSKKGKPVMIFVGVRGTPDKVRTEERYVVADDRVLFMVEDGSLAWDVKDYLTTLTECTTVSFDQLSFNCKDDKKTEL